MEIHSGEFLMLWKLIIEGDILDLIRAHGVQARGI